MDVADTESAATYMTLFRDLKGRGLRGVRLVTSDDHAGLRAAIERYFQGAGWQRCQVHYTRNLVGMVGARKRKEMAAGRPLGSMRALFTATTPIQARAIAQQIADRWRSTHPAVARSLEEESEACFACLAFPLAHQQRIRTTNGMERLNQELKRRTRVIRIFPNRDACLRLVTALCVEQSEEWESGWQYLDISELPAGLSAGGADDARRLTHARGGFYRTSGT